MLVIPALPAAWGWYVFLVLAHELGHAFFVRRYRGTVDTIDLWALGGFCRYRGATAPWPAAVVAWGGILAQLLILGVAGALVAAAAQPHSFAVEQLAIVLLYVNATMIAGNLLPVPPLDGAKAWTLPPLLWQRLKKKQKPKFNDDEQAIIAEFARRRSEKSKLDVH